MRRHEDVGLRPHLPKVVCDLAAEAVPSVAAARGPQCRLLMERRALLVASAGGLTCFFAASGLAMAAPGVDPWPAIDAALEHLFPAEDDAPGAQQIGAPAYLRGIVRDPAGDREEQAFVLAGARLLAQHAQRVRGRPFGDLAFDERELVLRLLVKSPAGELWVSTLMGYLCEALLADPVHGVNPNGVGWAWLQHQPGFPRPVGPDITAARPLRQRPGS